MNVEGTSRHLPGVKCVVNTCRYHVNTNHCNAKEIEVGVPNARSSKDTDCRTFSPRT